MSSPHELSKTVNKEARRRFPDVAKKLGMSSLFTAAMPRLALRSLTPYPYSFTRADTLLPKKPEGFGRVIHKNREEGIKEIHRSIGTQTQEHHWLFVPKADMWIDTGTEASQYGIASDQYAHIFLSHLYPEIESVHTHPDAVVRRLAQQEPWSYSKNYLLEAAQPSTNDIIGHYQMNARTAPDCRQTSSVISHHGVTSFQLTGARSAGLHTEAYPRLIDSSIDPVRSIRSALDVMSQHILRYDNAPALSIRFTPIS